MAPPAGSAGRYAFSRRPTLIKWYRPHPPHNSQDRSMGIIKAALGNVYAVIVLALLIMVLGLLAVASIPVDILPAFSTPAVQVLTFYSGMPATSVEKTITNRIERWVNQAPGVRRMESRSLPGVSVIKSYFREDINPNAALT